MYAVYKLAMDHYPEGPQSCRYIFPTLRALVDSAVSTLGSSDIVSVSYYCTFRLCILEYALTKNGVLFQFHKKSVLKTTYLSNWIMQNCPRLIMLLHRYIVHILSTGFRSISEKPQTEPSVSDSLDMFIVTTIWSRLNSFSLWNEGLDLERSISIWRFYSKIETLDPGRGEANAFPNMFLRLSCLECVLVWFYLTNLRLKYCSLFLTVRYISWHVEGLNFRNTRR